jgi:phosphatidylglycerophosphatase C
LSGGGLAVFDLDGTITRSDTLAPYLWGYLWRRPWRALRGIAGLHTALRYPFTHDRGAVKGAAVHAILGGASRESLDRWSDRFLSRLLPHGLFQEALAAIEEHRKAGDRLLLMSASTDIYVPRIGKLLGFDEVICTQVRWRDDGRLDGHLASLNCRGEEKLRCLAAVVAREQPDRIYAYGNSSSDLAHMKLAHEAFMINASSPAPVKSLRWQQRAVTLPS